MDEAERFVRDSMSFGKYPAPTPTTILDTVKLTVRRIGRLLSGSRNSDESNDPFSYVGAPIKPKPPRLRSVVRLPLP